MRRCKVIARAELNALVGQRARRDNHNPVWPHRLLPELFDIGDGPVLHDGLARIQIVHRLRSALVNLVLQRNHLANEAEAVVVTIDICGLEDQFAVALALVGLVRRRAGLQNAALRIFGKEPLIAALDPDLADTNAPTLAVCPVHELGLVVVGVRHGRAQRGFENLLVAGIHRRRVVEVHPGDEAEISSVAVIRLRAMRIGKHAIPRHAADLDFVLLLRHRRRAHQIDRLTVLARLYINANAARAFDEHVAPHTRAL